MSDKEKRFIPAEATREFRTSIDTTLVRIVFDDSTPDDKAKSLEEYKGKRLLVEDAVNGFVDGSFNPRGMYPGTYSLRKKNTTSNLRYSDLSSAFEIERSSN